MSLYVQPEVSVSLDVIPAAVRAEKEALDASHMIRNVRVVAANVAGLWDSMYQEERRWVVRYFIEYEAKTGGGWTPYDLYNMRGGAYISEQRWERRQMYVDVRATQQQIDAFLAEEERVNAPGSPERIELEAR